MVNISLAPWQLDILMFLAWVIHSSFISMENRYMTDCANYNLASTCYQWENVCLSMYQSVEPIAVISDSHRVSHSGLWWFFLLKLFHECSAGDVVSPGSWEPISIHRASVNLPQPASLIVLSRHMAGLHIGLSGTFSPIGPCISCHFGLIANKEASCGGGGGSLSVTG